MSPHPADARVFRSPQIPRGLLPSLAVLALVMFASYAGLGQVLLPNQLTLIDEPNKVANLAHHLHARPSSSRC